MVKATAIRRGFELWLFVTSALMAVELQENCTRVAFIAAPNMTFSSENFRPAVSAVALRKESLSRGWARESP